MRRFPAPVMPALVVLALLFVALLIPQAGLAQLPSPIPREPAPGATVTALTFAWDPVPEAVEYEIEIWAMQVGNPVEKVWEATTLSTTVTPRDVSNIPQGDLSWQVRLVDSEGRRSAWGQSQLTYQIDVPALITPADGAPLTAGQPLRFEWSAAAGAQVYQIDIATDAAFSNTVWSATTSDTSIIPPFPIGTGDLYWRVQGHAPGGNPGRTSVARHFTRTVGTPQNLIGPEGATPTFLWDRVADATSYNVQVWATPDFDGTPLWEADTVNTRIVPVTAAFGAQTRYWRVRARDAGGFTSAWADGAPFALTPPGGVETLDLQWPEPDAVLQADPDFRWQAVEGADHYVLQVSTDPAFTTLYDEIETNYNAYTPFSNLIQSDQQRRAIYANGVYHWRVRAVIPAGTDILSEERRFTKAVTINLLEPTGGTSVSGDPTFRWQGMMGAHHYRLVVGNNAAFEPVWDTVESGSTGYIPFSAAADEQDTYANGTYFWKIEALDSDGVPLAISDPASFSKATPLDLVTPADGAVQLSTPTFVWSPVAGAYRYRLTVNTGPDFLTLYDQITTDATRYTPYVGEIARATYDNGAYRWTVEALDNLGQVIARSESRQLTIGEVTATPPATPTQTSTPSPSATPTHTATLTWTASPTPTSTRTSTPSPIPSPTPSPTVTPPPTATSTPTMPPTATSSATPAPSLSPTTTQGPTHTPSLTPTAGPSPTAGYAPPSPTPPSGGRTDTDEPNDDWALAAPLTPGVHQSYVSHERDLDWFKVRVDSPRSELRITLVHPPADYDLVLLGDPTGIDIINPPGMRAIQDMEEVDQTGWLRAPEEIGDIGVLQDARPVRDISARRGLKSETVATNVLYQPGWYYILVKGYNGAHSRHPYTLNVEVDSSQSIRHCTVELPHPSGVITARWVASEAPETLILINKRRMDAYYGTGPGSTEQLLTEIRELADHAAVNGLIEPVENDPDVAAAYEAWDDDACNPEAANRVTEAIKHLIDEVREMYPTLRRMLIIGNDDLIPFHRVPDEATIANESEYLAQVEANPDSPFYSSLGQGYVLTNDFYVDDEPLVWRGRRLYVPDYPIGRLVETPGEISHAIEAFLATNGNLSLDAGLVLGYGFSAGSSGKVADILRSAGVDVESMIATGWTGSDLRDGLLNTHHDVNMVHARFSHNEALSPDQIGGPLTAEAVAEVGGPLRRSLFFSIGSHAGLNVPDRWAAAPDQLDFSQAFCGLGVASVANTGYGYGIAQADDYSESLMTYFTQELTSTPDVTVGEALMRAKQRFFAGAGPASFGLYHEKTLIEATLFGIPALRITVPNLAVPAGDPKQVIAESMQALGGDLYKRTVHLEPRFVRVDTPAGSYLTADDGTVSRPGRPVQPRFTWGVGEPELAAHGALLMHATYTDFADFDPVITHPLTDTTGPEPGFPFSGWTPARLHVINRLSTADGTSEQLVVIPGQFKNEHSSSELTYGVERRYDSLTFDLYYSTSPDRTPPTIWQVRLERTALGVEFWVEATDQSGVKRVIITYTRGDGVWETEELQFVGDFSWQALMPFFEADTLDFVAQVVDDAGNVAMSVDKGRLFGRQSHTFYLVPVMR